MRFMRSSLALLFCVSLAAPAWAANEISDLACETTTTTGQGTLSLGGAASGGYLGVIASGISDGATIPYRITTGTGVNRKIESGMGVVTDASPDTLTRASDIVSSDGIGTKLTLSGTSTVCLAVTDALLKSGSFGIDVEKLQGAVPDDTAYNATTWDANTDLPTKNAVRDKIEAMGAGGLVDGDYGDITVGGSGTTLTIDADSVALTTDTTGNYAAGDGEAGAALTGDSATSFFSSGTIEDARISGSAEADEVLNSDKGDFTCATGSCTIDGDAIALGTDTTGNYVLDVADGTGVDGTAAGEGATYTPSLDFTEISSLTWGAGSFTSMTFDVATSDPVITASANTLTISSNTTAPIVVIDDQGSIHWTEEDANGSNYKAFAAPATITGDNTCTFENDANFIPDSCVGDGSDDDVPESGDFTNLTGGSGIDNNSGTLDFDATEISSATWGAGSFTAFTFDAGATDPVLTLGSATATWSAVTTYNLDDEAELRLFEEDAGGSNYKGFKSPAAVTASTTCTFEDDANFIPDSCVGDGSDADTLGSDGDKGDITVGGTGTTLTIDGDSVALTTDTTGVYVAQVADGTGVDGTANAEGATYTPTLDLTEINTFTLGAGSATGIIFDAGATDPAIEVASGSLTIDIGGTNELVLNATNLTPGANDGNALGASGTAWADLFLAAGGLIEFDGGTTNTLTCTGGNCTIEGNGLYRAGGTDVAVADGGTGASALTDLIALTTHTTGSYVQQVADGTGIDGSVNSEGGTYTPTLDLTEQNTQTFGSGTFTTATFDAGATDPVLTFGSGTLTLSAIAQLNLDDELELRFFEEDAGGSNYIGFKAPAAITSNTTCTFENDSSPIPDSCVGNGVDDGAGGGISNVVEDTDPELGGNLNTNTFNIILDASDFLVATDATGVIDENGNEQLLFDTTASAVNEITLANAAAGTYPTFTATGDDAAIGMNFVNKGAGVFRFTDAAGTGALIVTNTASGAVKQVFRSRVDGAVNNQAQIMGSGTVDGSNAGWGAIRYSADALGPRNSFAKVRDATLNTFTVIQDGDVLGELLFNGADGTDFEIAAAMRAEVDGSPGGNDMPGRLVFSTTADAAVTTTDRLVIKNDGGVIVGPNDTSPGLGNLLIDAEGDLRFGEAEANGDNYIAIQAPAALTSDVTCTLENDANPIPDSCVGDGSDGGGSLADADYGDITVSSSGASWNIDADTVTPTELAEAGDYAFTGTVTLDNDALHILDTNASHDLIITPGSDLTVDRVFTITTGDAARTLTISANATLNDADYGDITTSSSFTSWQIDADAVGTNEIATDGVDAAEIAADAVRASEIQADAVNPSELAEAGDYAFTGTVTFDADAVHIFDTNASHDLIITPGSDLSADRVLTLTTGDSARTVTISGNATISQDYSSTGSPTFANPTVTTLELGAAATDATFARTGAGEATLEGDAIKHAGKQMMWIPAGGMKNSSLSPADCAATYDSGSNDVTIAVCAFDTGATEENAEFGFGMPKGWNESTVTAQVAWTNTGGASTETVQWKIACTGFGDDDALNTAYPADVTISDTWTAQNDYTLTSETGAITVQNAAEGDFVNCRIGRDTSVDNMAGDALLVGIKFFWTDNASTLAE